MDKRPLVSIPVITYNSSEYIIEGLESVKAQTYKNIELVISDDCSTDNTVDICKNWIEENRHYFKRAVLITADKNTGVAGNLNRAIRECRGEWIKVLSGDDILLINSITDYCEFVTNDDDINICFGKLKFICDKNPRTDSTIKFYHKLFEEIKKPENQYKRYLKNHYIPGTGLYFRKSLWQKVGGFNEDYPFCEEFPFTLKILEMGEIIYFLDKEVYGYNIHDGSLSNSEKPVRRNFNDRKRFFFNIKIWKIIKKGYILQAYDEMISYLWTQYKYFETPNIIKKMILIYLRMISPIYMLYHVKRLLKRLY